mgnify:CR=1 FL=1
MTSVETLPPTSAINKFLYTISTDENGKIGSNYVDHNEALEYILSITPEKFEELYYNYKTLVNESNEKEKFCWLYEDRSEGLKFIHEIYKEIHENKEIYDHNLKQYILDKRPLTFRFALMLWLYIYH